MHGSTVARALVGVERPGSDAAAQAPTLPVPGAAQPDNTETTAAHAGSAAIRIGSYRCRYAGAMMLFPYLNLVGATSSLLEEV